jgi:hypothetical protein
MEDLNLQRYDAILVGKISGELQNICNFVPMNTVSKRRRLFINMVCKPKILFLEINHTRGTGLMLKDNVDPKFDFIGTFDPNAPLADVVEE